MSVPEERVSGEQGSSSGPRLFKSSWQVGGVHLSPLDNAWLLEALNVVAGDSEVRLKARGPAAPGCSARRGESRSGPCRRMRTLRQPRCRRLRNPRQLQVVEKIFVDTRHADEGFFAVRLWADDPTSEEDWALVLVDDK